MKKVIGVLAVTLLFVVLGCSKSNVVTIEMVSGEPRLENIYREAISTFESKHPNVKVTLASNAGDIYAYVASIAQSGSDGADIFPTHGNKTVYMGNFADAGIIKNLDGLLDVSDFPPLMVQRSKHKGHLYMSPSAFGDVFPIFYNKDIFNKYNLKIPNNFEELEAINKTLMANNVQPFTIDGLNVWGLGWNFWNFVSIFAPEWTEKFCVGLGSFDDPQFRVGMRRMKEWIDSGYFGTTWKELDGAGATLELTSGKAAMFCNQEDMAGVCEAAGMNFGAFYWPMPGGGKYMMAGQATFTGFAVRANGNKAKEDASLELVKYLMSDEMNQKIGDIDFKTPYKKTISTKSEVLNSLKTSDKIVPLWSDQMTYRSYENVNGYDILNDYAQRYFFGFVTLDQAIAEFVKIIDPGKVMSKDEMVSWEPL